jgi:hypothetical protein
MNECLEWERVIANTLQPEDYKRFAAIKMLGKHYRTLHPGQPDPTAKRRILIVWITELHCPVTRKLSQTIRDTRRDLIMVDILQQQWTILALSGFNTVCYPAKTLLYPVLRAFTQLIKCIHIIVITVSPIKNMTRWGRQYQVAWWDICGGGPIGIRWKDWCLLYTTVVPDEKDTAMELSPPNLSSRAIHIYNQYRTASVRTTSKLIQVSLENASHPDHALMSDSVRELVNAGQLTVTRSSWYKFVLRASKPFRLFSQQVYNTVKKHTSPTSASIVAVCRSNMHFVSSLIVLMQHPPPNETDCFFTRSKLIVNTQAGNYTSKEYRQEWEKLRGSKTRFGWEMNTNCQNTNCD